MLRLVIRPINVAVKATLAEIEIDKSNDVSKSLCAENMAFQLLSSMRCGSQAGYCQLVASESIGRKRNGSENNRESTTRTANLLNIIGKLPVSVQQKNHQAHHQQIQNGHRVSGGNIHQVEPLEFADHQYRNH